MKKKDFLIKMLKCMKELDNTNDTFEILSINDDINRLYDEQYTNTKEVIIEINQDITKETFNMLRKMVKKINEIQSHIKISVLVES